MPYGLDSRTFGYGYSLALVAASPTARANVAVFLGPPSRTAFPGSWSEIYRQAYEQARATLTPSRFQVMLQPCWN